MSDKANLLAQVCAHLLNDNRAKADALLRQQYPFAPVDKGSRGYTPVQCTSVFPRDGFIDRYCGAKLVFPSALRLLALLLPTEFPLHRNWKLNATHPAFWELFPTIDHVVPVARGGADDESNWVSTSMFRNAAKANWTLGELGWELAPPGNITQWDGLLGWFRKYVRAFPAVLADPYLRRWHGAATVAGRARSPAPPEFKRRGLSLRKGRPAAGGS
jgi:hypothetical protein